MSAYALSSPHRTAVVDILTAAIQAADPFEAVLRHVTLVDRTLHIGARRYPLDALDRILVVGGGKAGAPMAAALYRVLGTRLTDGVVTVKYGHAAASGRWRVRFGGEDAAIHPILPPTPQVDTGPVAIVEAGHPMPDAAGQAGAQRIAGLLHGLTARDLVIVLISGGGSALLPLPAPGISLADYQALTGLLLRCGAEITEINAVRKHCSGLQGGQLARLASPAQVVSLVLSDVVGAPLDAIASGPTAPDHSTFAQAWAVLQRYGIADQAPDSVREHLQRGLTGQILDTPKANDPLFRQVNNAVIGDNAAAGRAAVAAAQRLGFHSALLTSFVQGEAREVARVMAGLAQGIACGQSDFAMPACLVVGGETTVTIRGSGAGGRNQELALAAAIALDGYPLPPGVQAAIVSLGTDGTDGPTRAAGGMAAGDSLSRARALGLDAHAALADNDSYPFLAALGDLIFTGPTQTNVNDLILILCWAGD